MKVVFLKGGDEMSDQRRLDFLSAFGEEFCDSLSLTVGTDNVVPQDGYEVMLRAFGMQPSPEVLSALSDSQVEAVRAECARYFECEGITAEQIRTAVSRTLRAIQRTGKPRINVSRRGENIGPGLWRRSS